MRLTELEIQIDAAGSVGIDFTEDITVNTYA